MNNPTGLQQDQFRDLSAFSVWATALTGVLGASFWIWDFSVDALGAQTTAGFRLLMLISGLIPTAIAHLSDKKAPLAAALFATPLVWSLLALASLLSTNGDTIYGTASFVFLQIGGLLVLQCFSYRTAAIGHLLLAALPQLAAALFGNGHFDHGHYTTLVWPTVLLALLIQNHLQAQYASRHALQERLAKIALTDPPTGAFNRHHFNEAARNEVDRAKKTGLPLCLALVDLDNLRAINESHGHAGGDIAIHALARLLHKSLRTSDLTFRWGGGVFLVLAPSTNAIQGRRLGERLLKAWKETEETPAIGTTISIGVAEMNSRTLQELVEATESALLEAKSKGRNCMIVAETPVETNPAVMAEDNSREEKVSR
ncbi:uncharacterized protein NMK_2960 [Novimethylophilus kurashikiensis]|uniref:diguanylate cyclase n=1 Tax=Novimethylophilus kurashikiensis TaxID=1825523 RepID=A0A2R5FBE7_9PROT|nr:uncharacterized protein NMK_2960 [Novimethylophilus kurashikiensis]